MDAKLIRVSFYPGRIQNVVKLGTTNFSSVHASQLTFSGLMPYCIVRTSLPPRRYTILIIFLHFYSYFCLFGGPTAYLKIRYNNKRYKFDH